MFAPDVIFKSALDIYTHILGNGVAVSGNHLLPPGPKIIAGNHTVSSDPLFLPSVLDEKPHFLFQDELFKIPVVDWLLKHTEQIPVKRDTERAKEAFAKACDLLREGKTIVIFPEGKQVLPGQRIPAKTGTVRMSLATGAPIVPLGIYVPESQTTNLRIHWQGCERAGLWQISGKCHLRFGAAWKPDAQSNIHEQTDELMDRIYSLVTDAQKETQCASHTSLNPIPQW